MNNIVGLPSAQTVGRARSNKRIINIRCVKDIMECINNSFEIISPIQVKGSGSFGTVIRGISKNGKPLVIKIIIVTDGYENMEDIRTELEYSKWMSEERIGPKVYEAFHYKMPYRIMRRHPILYNIIEQLIEKKRNGEIHNQQLEILTRPGNGDVNTFCQFIVMEEFDMDCETALNSREYPINIKNEIVGQMLDILIKKINAGLYCYDSKASNFVVNVDEDTYRVVVRIIDFGPEYCNDTTNRYTKIFSTMNNRTDYMGFNSSERFFLFSVIQIYMAYNFNENQGVDLIPAFFDNDIFDAFFSGDKEWRLYLSSLITEAYKAYTERGEYDILNHIMWYSKPAGVPIHSIDELHTKDNINKVYDKLVRVLEVVEQYRDL